MCAGVGDINATLDYAIERPAIDTNVVGWTYVINRLSRAIGHLEAVKRMAEEGRDCSELLVQLAAVRSALNATSRIILKDHIAHCIVDAVEHGDQETLEALNRAIDRMME